LNPEDDVSRSFHHLLEKDCQSLWWFFEINVDEKNEISACELEPGH
jgi:hypothetical protein